MAQERFTIPDKITTVEEWNQFMDYLESTRFNRLNRNQFECVSEEFRERVDEVLSEYLKKQDIYYGRAFNIYISNDGQLMIAWYIPLPDAKDDGSCILYNEQEQEYISKLFGVISSLKYEDLGLPEEGKDYFGSAIKDYLMGMNRGNNSSEKDLILIDFSKQSTIDYIIDYIRLNISLMINEYNAWFGKEIKSAQQKFSAEEASIVQRFSRDDRNGNGLIDMMELNEPKVFPYLTHLNGMPLSEERWPEDPRAPKTGREWLIDQSRCPLTVKEVMVEFLKEGTDPTVEYNINKNTQGK